MSPSPPQAEPDMEPEAGDEKPVAKPVKASRCESHSMVPEAVPHLFLVGRIF